MRRIVGAFVADVSASGPGSARFVQRAREAASLGRRELEASVAALGRIDLDSAVPAAALAQEERALALLVDRLREQAYLAQELDRAAEAAAASLREDRAQPVRLEILYPLRERRQALLAQLALCTQGLAALRLALR